MTNRPECFPSSPPHHPSSHEAKRSNGIMQQISGRLLQTTGMDGIGSRITDVQTQLMGMDISQTREFTRLEHQTRINHDKILNLEQITAKDMQTLHKMILDLQTEVDATRNGVQTVQFISTKTSNQDITPSEEMLQSFDKDTLADAYIFEAEDIEKLALKLRAQAAALRKAEQDGSSSARLLEAPPPAKTIETDAGFACCGRVLYSIDELVQHISNFHVEYLPKNVTQANTTSNHNEDEGESSLPVAGANGEQSKSAKAVEGNTSNITVQEHFLNKQALGKNEWMPLVVINMPPGPEDIPSDHDEMFPWEFLRSQLGGEEWSPGFYFISSNSILPNKGYWMLEGDYEPYLPRIPGGHGAKLTAFFNNTPGEEGEGPAEENYLDTPVFIRRTDEKGYRYYGNYSQTRFSDKLDYECIITHVPEQIRSHWADQLADMGRPNWVTEALKQHFLPKPEYEGPLPATESTAADSNKDDGSVASSSHSVSKYKTNVTKALAEYANELKEWEAEASEKVRALTAADLIKAFENPDCALEPGLRLWWEYLQCTKYDVKFYEMLVNLQRMESPRSKSTRFSTPRASPNEPTTPKTGVSTDVRGSHTVRKEPKQTAYVPVSNKTVRLSEPPKHRTHTKGKKPWQAEHEQTAPRVDPGVRVRDFAGSVPSLKQQSFTSPPPPDAGDIVANKFAQAQKKAAANGTVASRQPPHLRKNTAS